MIKQQAIISTKVSNPNDACPAVQLEITPEVSEVGTVYTLHLFGQFYIPVPNYNGWVWQTADKFEAPGVINTNPSWSNAAFGQLTYTQTQPNKIVRVYFNIGDCLYYSNISGLEKIQTPINPTITNSVILNVSGTDDHTLQADVRISSNPGNILNIQPDGLYATFEATEECPCCDRIWLDVFPPFGGPVLTLLAEGFTPSSAFHVWQRYTGSAWQTLKIGGATITIGEVGLVNPLLDGDIVRVQYTDSKGCIHYSSLNNVYAV